MRHQGRTNPEYEQFSKGRGYFCTNGESMVVGFGKQLCYLSTATLL